LDFIRKRIPTGQEDFKSIIENGYYFVDKTMLIKDVIEQHGFVNFITRPRRFGKTLNMSMLQRFFEDTSEDVSHLYGGLKISAEKEICNEYMGKYPVISLTLMNAKRSAFEDALASLRFTISEEFRRHREIVNQYPDYRDKIERIQQGLKEDINDYVESIRLLSMILHEHYQKKVIILIDEYDVPLEAAYANGYYQEMLDFLRALLNYALKSNPYLEFAVLTGCLKLSKESVFTGLNNFSTYSLTELQFTQYFGFTPDEVLAMLAHYELTDKQAEMKSWFDGYTIGNYEIYNPWSVIKQVNEYLTGGGQPVAHWANTSSNDIVKTFISKAELSTKAEIEELLAGKTIEKTIAVDLTYNEVFSNVENLWTFLFYTGYLTADEIRITGGVRYAKLRIPNIEVRYIFETKIRQWFDESIADSCAELYAAILERDSKKLQDAINTILFESISYMDFNENYYHGFMVGLLAKAGYLLKSNRETGLGRADITLSSKDTAVIIELKTAASARGMSGASRAALNQINERHYADEFAQSNIIKIGIAFYKKACAVVVDS